MNREEYINLLRRKEERRTDEEDDYEYFTRTLYEDEIIELEKFCWDFYIVRGKKTGKGVESRLDGIMEEPLREICGDDFEDKTLIEYLEQRGFPIMFKTW